MDRIRVRLQEIEAIISEMEKEKAEVKEPTLNERVMEMEKTGDSTVGSILPSVEELMSFEEKNVVEPKVEKSMVSSILPSVEELMSSEFEEEPESDSDDSDDTYDSYKEYNKEYKKRRYVWREPTAGELLALAEKKRLEREQVELSRIPITKKVIAFLDWWDTKPPKDAHYNEMIASIATAMREYVFYSGDMRAIAWVYNNRDLLPPVKNPYYPS